MRRLVCVFVALLAFSSARADALTIRDIVELTRAGLGEEVLLALIEVDPSVFPIDTATLKYLKDAGVSQRVIVAMVRSARTPPPPVAPDPIVAEVAPQAPEPQVVVIDHHDAERVREVPVAVPVLHSRRAAFAGPAHRQRRSSRSRARHRGPAGSDRLVEAGPPEQAGGAGLLGHVREAPPGRLEAEVSCQLQRSSFQLRSLPAFQTPGGLRSRAWLSARLAFCGEASWRASAQPAAASRRR